MEIHPEFLKKNGKREFVILPYEEFRAIHDRLLDAEDVLELRHAKQEESDAPAISLSEVRKRFGLSG